MQCIGVSVRRVGAWVGAFAGLALGGQPAASQGVPASAIQPAWLEPAAPFRIVGNVYYVGSRGLACYLIASPAGHVLLDTGLEQVAPMVLDNVATLGFRARDIRVILSGHAHYDHVAGHAYVKSMTGARVYASAPDARLLESGGREDFRFGGEISFPPVTVDHRIADGEQVTVGPTTLTAHLTPGHTKGNTTWTMTVVDSGVRYNVVFAGSMTINPGVHMVNYPPNPGVADDYARSFALLESLHPDIPLGSHGGFFNLDEKARRLAQGTTPNPFIDPQGYRDQIAAWKKVYLAQLDAERPRP
jgi:metallo-beta-lactamase class B